MIKFSMIDYVVMSNMKYSVSKLKDEELRNLLVSVSLEWEKRFAVAPHITSDIAEYDAARIVGTSLEVGKGRTKSDTAVMKGYDFWKKNERFQVKSNRPSGKPGSKVTLVGKASNFNWDKLVWILYNRDYVIQEAWEFEVDYYKKLFEIKKRLSPKDMRQGNKIF